MRTAARMGLVVVAGVMAGRSAAARRRFFEPTDLEMEHPGVVEVDLQCGVLHGSNAPWRVALPDVEVDIGLAPGAEIDIDGAYAIEDINDGASSFDHVPDDLWVAVKLALYDAVDAGTSAGWTIGTQLGPKLPTSRDSRGVGYEGLVLVGRHWGNGHLVLNLGGLVDPGAAVTRQRPAGLEGGVDLSVALPGTSFSLTGELGGVRYLSGEPHQLHATAGISWAMTSAFDVSLIGLVGFLPGGDRAGVLLGVSPKIALWN